MSMSIQTSKSQIPILLERKQSDSWNDLGKRVVLASLPFFCLYGPSGRVITIGSHMVVAVRSLQECYSQENMQNIAQAAGKTVLATASVFFALIQYPFAIAMMTCGSMILDIRSLIIDHKEKSKQEIQDLILSLCSSSFYAGMLLTGLPEVILTALILQAVIELKNSRQEFQKGRELEGYAHLALSCVRVLQAVPSATITYNKWTASPKDVQNNNVLKSDAKSLDNPDATSLKVQELWPNCHFKAYNGMLVAYHKNEIYFFNETTKQWQMPSISQKADLIYSDDLYEVSRATAEAILQRKSA